MQEFGDQANKDAGTKVDTMTINLGVAVFCNLRVVNFMKRVEVSFTSFRPGWEARKQAQWNQIYCDGGPVTLAIASGWRITHTITDIDGRRHFMEATCR
jgi:hypothetical protein